MNCADRGGLCPAPAPAPSCRSCSSRLRGHVHICPSPVMPPGTHSLTVSPALRCGSLCHPPVPPAGTSVRSPARERWSKGREGTPSPQELALCPPVSWRAGSRPGKPRWEVILSNASEELSAPRGCSPSPLPCTPTQGGFHGCLLPPAGHTEGVKKLPVGSRRCPMVWPMACTKAPKWFPTYWVPGKSSQ